MVISHLDFQQQKSDFPWGIPWDITNNGTGNLFICDLVDKWWIFISRGEPPISMAVPLLIWLCLARGCTSMYQALPEIGQGDCQDSQWKSVETPLQG